jgi:3-dehydroquinate dehydratase type I
MNSKHVLPVQEESFAMLVKRLKACVGQADIYEIWLDQMKVRGDLAVIRNYFGTPILAKSESLDLLKRAVKAGLDYIDVPHDLEVDLDFSTMAKNKGATIIRSYHNFKETPQNLEQILKDMDAAGGQLLKIAAQNDTAEDSQRLLDLLKLPKYKDRLIIAGMGADAETIRVQAPLQGSVMYFAPLTHEEASAPGQLTKDELSLLWKGLSS